MNRGGLANRICPSEEDSSSTTKSARDRTIGEDPNLILRTTVSGLPYVVYGITWGKDHECGLPWRGARVSIPKMDALNPREIREGDLLNGCPGGKTAEFRMQEFNRANMAAGMGGL